MFDFADMDRNGMMDLIYFKDNTINVFYNRYSANPVTETNLCKQPLDTKYLRENRIFSPFTFSTDDPYVLR